MSKNKNNRNLKKLSLLALGIALLIVSVSFFLVIRMFVSSIIVAATLVTLFYPVYKKLLKLFKSKNLTSLIFCLLLFVIMMVPIYFLGFIVVKQASDFSKTAHSFVTKTIEESESGKQDTFLEKIKQAKITQWLKIDVEKIEWKKNLLQSVNTLGKLFTNIINKTSKGVIWVVSNIFIVFFTMFYFFRDGDKIVDRLIFLSPFRPKYERKIATNFTLISRATIKGTVVIGLVQGSLGALTLLIFGVKSWLLWGVVMVFLSVIPLVGPWIVMIPIGIATILFGTLWQGLGIIIVCVFVISLIDNFMRPRLVGQDAKIHDLLIFFSTLGGLAVFGLMGFIIGPVIAVLFVTVLDIYGLEFKSQLLLSQKRK